MVYVEGPDPVEVTPGVNMFAQVEGTGKPLILVHGWSLNHKMWRFQVPYLKKRGYQVVAVDLRGFGYSNSMPPDYNYDTWANDLGKAIEKFERQDVTLVGYSIGGAIAMHYLTTHTNPPVKTLTLVAAAGPYMSWKSTNWEEKWHCGHHHLFWDGLIALIEQEKQDYAFHQFYEGAFRGMKLDDLTQWIKSMFESASPEAALGGLRELRDKDITTSVSKIRIPTRIISGWTDVLVPFTLADVQQNLIAGATLTKLVAGHGLFFEKADELNLALMGELRQIPECPVDYCPVRWVVGKRT